VRAAVCVGTEVFVAACATAPGTKAPPATAPSVTAPPLIIVRRENLARRYSCCSAMLMRAASFSGTPMRGVSMAEKVLLATIAPRATG
jgi:hypothetical protein